MRKLFGILFMAAPLLLWNCTNDDGKDAPEPEVAPEEEEVVVPTSYDPVELTTEEISDFKVDAGKFAFNLAAASAREGENLVLSPYSAYYALSLLANGAKGATLDEMLTALGALQPDLDKLNSYNYGVMKALVGAMGYKFLCANSLWKAGCIDVKPLYEANLRLCYDAQVLDLNPATVVDDFNRWGAEHTEGIINNAAVDYMKNADLILANATFFAAQWAGGPYFDKSVNPGVFSNYDGTKTQTDFIEGTMLLPYCETDMYEGMRLELGIRHENDMYFILPKEGVTADAVLSDIQKNGWDAIKGMHKCYEVSHKFPKFRIETNLDLTQAMPAIGITAFNGNGDFSGLSKQALCPNAIYQNNCIATTEDGVTAAAITVELMCGSNSDDYVYPKAELTFDRPFLFVISEKSTGAILFMGKIERL